MKQSTKKAEQFQWIVSGQTLSLVFADLVQRTAAAGASFVLDVDNDLDPRPAGKAPRLRFGGLLAGGLVFAAASSPAIFSAADCSRSSVACCTVSSASFSDRRPKRLRCRPAS
jgi:hypothetical protein